MARPSANIPLSGTLADLATPIVQRGERDRQAMLDQSNLKTADQQQTLNDQTINQNKTALRTAATRAIAMDAMAANDLLKAGNKSEAGALLLHNIDRMEEQGIDTKQARRYVTLAATRPDLAVEFFEKQVLPVMKTTLPDLFKPELLDPNSVTESGQTIQKDPRTGAITAQAVPGFTAAPEAPVNNDLLQAVGADGSITPIQYNPRGQGFLTMDNKPYDLPAGAVVTRTGSPTGPISDVLPPNREVDRRRQEGSVRSFNDAASRAIELITANPDANTAMASLATLGAGLTQEAGAVARFMGVPRETFDPSQYDSVFKDLNIDNAALQSVITSLAFQAAAAKDVRGSGVSNRDVERFIRQVGGNYSNPSSMLSALRETVNDVNSSYANEYQSLYNTPFEGDLGVPQFPDLGGSPPANSGLTPEEQAELQQLEAELIGR